MATGYIMLDTPNPNTPQGGLPRRSGFKPTGTCIVHTSEGAWSAGVDSLTNLVRTRTDYGCYHRACDWADIALYYPWEWECWQDSETNNWAVGIAAACRTEDWGNMPADVEDGFYRNMARMAADFVVYMRSTYRVEVPRVRITGAQARAGAPGFCAHGDSGISRTDPGARFDWARFFKYINQALAGTLTAGTEDDMSADMPMKSKDGANVTLQDVLNSIDKKVETVWTRVDKFPVFDTNVRAEFDVIRADRAHKDAQIAALTDAVTALAAAKSNVDPEVILARIDAGMERFKDSYQVVLQHVDPAPAPAAEVAK